MVISFIIILKYYHLKKKIEALLYKYKDKGIPFTISNELTSVLNIDNNINKSSELDRFQKFLEKNEIAVNSSINSDTILVILLIVFIIIFILIMLKIYNII